MTDMGIGTYDKFIAYRGVIMRAIARAWRDEHFYQAVKSNPKKALKDAFGYNFPFDVDLEVRLDTATWEPDVVADWVVHTRDLLEMVLPPPPEDPAERVEALAAFNAQQSMFLRGACHAQK